MCPAEGTSVRRGGECAQAVAAKPGGAWGSRSDSAENLLALEQLWGALVPGPLCRAGAGQEVWMCVLTRAEVLAWEPHEVWPGLGQWGRLNLTRVTSKTLPAAWSEGLASQFYGLGRVFSGR